MVLSIVCQLCCRDKNFIGKFFILLSPITPLIFGTLLILSIVSLSVSVSMCYAYGMGNIDLKLSGSYKVGHRVIFTKNKKQPVSVFYPMDPSRYQKQLLSKQVKWFLDYRENDDFLVHLLEANKWISGEQ